MEQLWETAATRRQAYPRYLWVAMLAVFYGTGLRRGELIGLDVSDWHSEEGTLLIDGVKTGLERRVAVPALTWRCLEAYLPHRQNQLERMGRLGEPALFVNQLGGRIRPTSISQGLKTLADRCDAGRITLHQFRHSCASDLLLLYGTGIRASECAHLREEDVDLDDGTVRVTGKGGHQRTLPLNDCVVETMRVYRQARGPAGPRETFFRSRSKRGLSRNAVYERVRRWARQAGIHKRVSPHRLRHTFATHLVKAGVDLVTIRDLLGHRLITSTQIYLHVTATDLREAADAHPIRRLAPRVEHLLPDVKLPFQPPPVRRNTG
jgi:site-specific recombinase XerD